MKGKFDAYDLPKVPKLNSRPVYCLRLYGRWTSQLNLGNMTGGLETVVSINKFGAI